MGDFDKTELELRTGLYQFHMNLIFKVIAFSFVVKGILLKFALDKIEYRGVFSIAAIIFNCIFLLPLIYGICGERRAKKHFIRLAKATNTQPFGTTLLKIILYTAAVLWILELVGWVYIWKCLKYESKIFNF